MKGIKTILKTEKLPFLFTIIAGAFLWAINSLIMDEINAPIVCYSIKNVDERKADDSIYKKVIKDDGLNDKGDNLKKKHLKLIVQNLSNSKKFESIYIIVCFRKGKKNLSPQRFFGLDMIAISPAGIDSAGNFYETDDDPESIYSTRALEFSINSFQPGNKYEIDFYTIYNADISENPVPYVSCNTEIKFVKKGFTEWLIINKFSLILLSLVLFLGLIISYGIWIVRNAE